MKEKNKHFYNWPNAAGPGKKVWIFRDAIQDITIQGIHTMTSGSSGHSHASSDVPQ